MTEQSERKELEQRDQEETSSPHRRKGDREEGTIRVPFRWAALLTPVLAATLGTSSWNTYHGSSVDVKLDAIASKMDERLGSVERVLAELKGEDVADRLRDLDARARAVEQAVADLKARQK